MAIAITCWANGTSRRSPKSGATGPFDGWPLGRGFDRFYGFLDAETDQYAPELVRDNTPIDAAGTFATGYHLTSDLVDQAIRYHRRSCRRQRQDRRG